MNLLRKDFNMQTLCVGGCAFKRKARNSSTPIDPATQSFIPLEF